MMRPGQISWCEVTGTDGAKLQAFYAELLGWSFTPMAAMPAYGLMMRDSEAEGPGVGVGPAAQGPGMVTFYVEVEDIAAAVAAAARLGGTVVLPPMAIPSGTIALIADPEGHVVGLSQM